MTIRIHQADSTVRIIPNRDYTINPRTPEEQKIHDNIAGVFQKSMEPGGSGYELKKRIETALEESYRAEREYKEYVVKANKEKAERQEKEDAKMWLFLLFFPITIPLGVLYVIFLLIGLEWEHRKYDKETKIRLEKDRERLKNLGYHDDEIIIFNG